MKKEKLAYRKFNIILISATNLTDARLIFRAKFYAKVTIGANKKTSVKTPTDKRNRNNPVWNHPIKYKIAEADVLRPGLGLVIDIYCRRCLRKDKVIGSITTSVGDLFGRVEKHGCFTTKTWAVKNGTGEVTFSFKFGKKLYSKSKKSSFCWKFLMCGCSTLKFGAQMAILASTGTMVQ